jgi:RNA polymerase sigma-70 factor (ECF subfamily)
VSSSSQDELQQAIDAKQWRSAALACARRYGADVGRLCMAMLGERAVAEEAAQETLLAAYQGLPTYRGEAPVRAWLLGIARKKCLRVLEQRRLRLALPNEAAASMPNAEEWLLHKAQAERARSALAQIKPSEREALLLRYQSGLSYEDIASLTAVDSAAVRKRVSRALLRLRALVADTDTDPKDPQS